MKNLALALTFLFALAGVVHTLNAEAAGRVKVLDADALEAPLMVQDDGAISADKKKEKKKKDGDKKKDDEESEEDYRLSPAAAALELVDPGAFEFAARMEAAARLR